MRCCPARRRLRLGRPSWYRSFPRRRTPRLSISNRSQSSSVELRLYLGKSQVTYRNRIDFESDPGAHFVPNIGTPGRRVGVKNRAGGGGKRRELSEGAGNFAGFKSA